MKSKSMFLAVLVLVSLSVVAAINTCSCDNGASKGRRLSAATKIRPHVNFVSADFGGIDYQRPWGSSSNINVDPNVVVEEFCDSEQVHVSFGDDPTLFVVTYASMEDGTQSTVWYSTNEDEVHRNIAPQATGSRFSYSELISVNKYLYAPVMGAPTTDKQTLVSFENTAPWAFTELENHTVEKWDNYKLVTTSSVLTGVQSYTNPYAYYNSPHIHTVTLTGIVPGQKYYYRVSGSCAVYHFTAPVLNEPVGSAYPFTLGLVSDVGQTVVSNASFNALSAMQPSAILMPGDLCYADGWPARWDSFARLSESLFSEIPLLTTAGNHEVGSAENNVNWNARYPTPHTGSGSSNPCYWGAEVGPVNVIGLCSYSGFLNNSLQYKWLTNYLNTSIDRERTPWVAVISHVPFYSSNSGHWEEGGLIRQTLETILFDAGVDIFMAGHVHVAERTHPSYQYEVNECGITHLTLGDGGNYENAYVPWRLFDQAMGPSAPNGAPLWSAFRESSFGVASFEIMNDTHAKYSWHRHACGSSSADALYLNFSDACVTPGDNSDQNMMTSDEFWLVRPSADVCPNRWYSSVQADVITDDAIPGAPTPAPSATPVPTIEPFSAGTSKASSSLGTTETSLVVVLVLSLVVNVLQFVLYRRVTAKEANDFQLMSDPASSTV